MASQILPVYMHFDGAVPAIQLSKYYRLNILNNEPRRITVKQLQISATKFQNPGIVYITADIGGSSQVFGSVNLTPWQDDTAAWYLSGDASPNTIIDIPAVALNSEIKFNLQTINANGVLEIISLSNAANALDISMILQID